MDVYHHQVLISVLIFWGDRHLPRLFDALGEPKPSLGRLLARHYQTSLS